ncbi:MAG: hypothetical protein QXS37_02275 [Candidatus Aenigmatarchaeota archaeon]
MDREKIYSEIRYLTIELMKISYEKKIPFEKVAKEFLKNVKKMIELIEEGS